MDLHKFQVSETK